MRVNSLGFQRVTFLIASVLIVLLVSCNNQAKQEKKDQGFKFNREEALSEIEITKSFIYALPSPGDLLERIGEAGLEYHEELSNPPSSAETYISSRDQALNLGVYITDLAYAAMFARTVEATEYLEVVRKLSNSINVSNSAYESIIDRAHNSIGNTDSLSAISNEVFYQMVEYLENSGSDNTIALISAGAYIESLYLAVKTAEDQLAESEIYSQITELKYPLQNLLDHAEQASDDPNVQSIMKYINDINTIFNELEREGEEDEVKNEEPGVITLGGGMDDVMDEKGFDKLKASVIDIRNSIVE